MTDDEQLAAILEMDERELLIFILSAPEFLTDSYYDKFRNVIFLRAVQLGVY
jgi:hypothetical protein